MVYTSKVSTKKFTKGCFMKRFRALPAIVASAIVVFVGTAESRTTANKSKGSKAASPSQEPITLNVRDLYPGKAELLEQAEDMTAQAPAIRDTVPYAARHKQFKRAVSLVQPPLSQWNADERATIQNVPEPTDAAKQHYADELKQGEEDVARRAADQEKAWQEQQARRAVSLDAAERARQQRVAEAQRWAEVDAMHRQADALYHQRDYHYPYYFVPGVIVTPTPKPTPKQVKMIKKK